MRYALPSPYREIPHTADVGVEVDGATQEEALARAVLALGQLLAGDGEVAPAEHRTVRARGDTPAELLVDVLRGALEHFFRDRLIPCAIETAAIEVGAWEGKIEFGRYDPGRHEGADIKAVTYAEARLERRGDRVVARAVFDV